MAEFDDKLRNGGVLAGAGSATRFGPEEVERFAERRHADGRVASAEETLTAVGQFLSTVADPNVIAAGAVRFASLLTGANAVGLYLTSPSSQTAGRLTIVSRLASLVAGEGDASAGAPLPESIPVPENEGIESIDLPLSPENDVTAETQPALLTPLRQGDQLLGALLVADWGGDVELSPHVIDRLESLSVMVSGALGTPLEQLPEPPPVEHPSILQIIVDTARTIALNGDLNDALRTIGDGLGAVVSGTFMNVYQADNQTRALHLLFHSELSEGIVSARDFTFGEGITGRVALSGTPLLVNHAERDSRTTMDLLLPSSSPAGETRLHLIAIPLHVEGTLVGVANVIRINGPSFSDDDYVLAQIFLGQAAGLIRNAELMMVQRERYLGGIQALVSAVDAKDAYARGHSARVSELAHDLAQAMALPAAVVDQVELAALLHDVGKIGIPDSILLKLGGLDETERAVMMGHTMLGAAILAESRSDALRDVIPLVRHHHEWYDGSGYPDGLAREEIPLGASIIALADAFVSMTTERPYRVGRALEGALDELNQGSGTQFDPSVVKAMWQLQHDGRLSRHTAAVPAHYLDSTPHLRSSREFVPPDPRPLPDGDGGGDVGQLGDLRVIGLMIELSSITTLIPDLPEFLQRVATLLQRRLDFEDIMVLLHDPDSESLTVAAQSGSLRLAKLGDRLPLGDNPWTDVYRTGELRSVPDFARAGTSFGDAAGSALLVPLIVEGKTIGMLHVAAPRTGAFTSGDTTMLQAIAGQIASSIFVAQIHDATKTAASTDGLTGLANHRAFYHALEEATQRQEPVGVLLFDVIGLKRVNDSAGHLAGDLLLQTVARTIREVVRPSDVVARYGGDEFAVILGGPMNDTMASMIGNRIREALHEAVREVDLPEATLRFGMAVLPEDGTSPHELVLTADRRMYQMNGGASFLERTSRPSAAASQGLGRSSGPRGDRA